jgi:hypothetical protein
MGSGSGRVEGYFEGYAIACVHFIEDLNRVEGSHDGHDLHALSNLELKPLYAAIFSAFVQNFDDRVVYGLFGIIYRLISYFQNCLFRLDLL